MQLSSKTKWVFFWNEKFYLRALIDADNKEYIGYFLPTAETRAKRTREEQDDADEAYDYKLIREYNWNRKDKTMSGFEENYFLSVKDDSIVYNELETR
jgi:RNA polymerase II-associated factor 1